MSPFLILHNDLRKNNGRSNMTYGRWHTALRENACPEPDSLRYVAAEVFRCSTCA